METSRIEMTGDAKVSADDLDKVRVPLGRPDGRHVAYEPNKEACDPKAKANAEGGGERTVDNGDRARRTAHQDRLGQRAMDWSFKAWDLSFH
jgi:hypothetical protein